MKFFLATMKRYLVLPYIGSKHETFMWITTEYPWKSLISAGWFGGWLMYPNDCPFIASMQSMLNMTGQWRELEKQVQLCLPVPNMTFSISLECSHVRSLRSIKHLWCTNKVVSSNTLLAKVKASSKAVFTNNDFREERYRMERFRKLKAVPTASCQDDLSRAKAP